MRQAIIIIADKDLTLLKKTISYFDQRFQIYIALDKKSFISDKDLIDIPNVKYVSKKYNINWGGWNMVQYTLDIIEEILKDPSISYAHLISGSDFPIKNVNEFYAYFSKGTNTDYLSYNKLPVSWKEWGGDGGFDRLKYYYVMDFFNVRRSFGRYIVYGWVKLQKILKIKRKFYNNEIDFYLGSQWWSLSVDCLTNITQYLKSNPWIFDLFKHTYIPDEMFFHTIIMNMHYDKDIENKNLRYFDWNIRADQNTRPAIMNISDFENLKNTDAFFARKFDSKISETLIEKLDKTLLLVE